MLVNSGLFPNFFSIWCGVSGFMVRPLNNLELSFMQRDKNRCGYVVLHADIYYDKYHFLKMLSFFPVYISGFFVKEKRGGILRYMDSCLIFISFQLIKKKQT